MNVFEFSAYFAAFFWALFFERSLFIIIMIILSSYLLIHFLFKECYRIQLRKKINNASWHKCMIPQGYLNLKVDMSIIEKKTGIKITEGALSHEAMAYMVRSISHLFDKLSEKGVTYFGHFIPAKNIILEYEDFFGQDIQKVTFSNCHRTANASVEKELRNFNPSAPKTFSHIIYIQAPRYLKSTLSYAGFYVKTAIEIFLGKRNFPLGLIRNYSRFDVESPHFSTTLKIMFSCAIGKVQDSILVIDDTPVVRPVSRVNFTFDTRIMRLEDVDEFSKNWNEYFANPTLSFDK